MLYKVLHERSNITASFTSFKNRLKFQENITSAHAVWVSSGKSKKVEKKDYTFWKCYVHGAPQKKQYHCFFRWVSKISRKKKTFTHAIWVNGGNAKGKNENEEARKFEKYIHRVLNETGNITAFFVEHLNFPE